MDGDIVIPQCSSVAQPDISMPNAAIEDRRRICPLCQSEVRLFFINLNEKMLMCENTNCEYPFGHEEIQFVKEDPEIPLNDGIFSLKESPTATASLVSAAAWSEIDKITRMCDIEDDHFELVPLKHIQTEKERTVKQNEKEIQIQQHIADIKELNMELISQSLEDEEDVKIKNEKWIKNLKNIQEMSGIQMLKPEEICLLKKEEPVLGLGELKIDIDHNISSIKIEIHNKPKPTEDNLETNAEPPWK